MSSSGVDVLVIGSGAGGATTAAELAQRGHSVLVVEEGRDLDATTYEQHSPSMMRDMYRHRGMNPLVGTVPVGAVEGCCVGGSTEINTGFWHRTPPDVLLGWQARFGLVDASPDDLLPHFEWAEKMLGVGTHKAPWPPSTQVFAAGVDKMGWTYDEVPRVGNAPDPDEVRRKHAGMRDSVLPRAREHGAVVQAGCRVIQLVVRGSKVVGALAEITDGDSRNLVRLDAKHVVVCCGATETPLLLRRSGIRERVGNSLRVHPMLKMVALYDEPVNSGAEPVPLLQVKQFWPDVSLGGAFYSPGHLAMALSDNWTENAPLMDRADQMATYYVAVKGNGRGSVRPSLLDPSRATIRYEVSHDDVRNLHIGLARLSAALLASGAEVVLPCVQGLPRIETQVDAIRWLEERLPRQSLSLTTVHLFSSCPMGERPDVCATDSWGRVRGFDNLWLNDASTLPDSPGVNPQGTIMALARRNAIALSRVMQ